MIVVGLDWSRCKHDFVSMNLQGEILERGTIAHNTNALEELATRIEHHVDSDKQVRVGLELNDGSRMDPMASLRMGLQYRKTLFAGSTFFFPVAALQRAAHVRIAGTGESADVTSGFLFTFIFPFLLENLFASDKQPPSIGLSLYGVKLWGC